MLHDLCVPSPAQVEGVSVRALSDTVVEVTWKSVVLPLEELTGYKVIYSQVEPSKKRLVGGTETFPGGVSSGVISGLIAGVSYQFQVTALARTVDGTEVEGEASVLDNSTMATPGQQGKLELGISNMYMCMY